jgi:hypothetical protein
MGNIVEWQSLRVQEYRYRLLESITKFWELFGLRRPMRFEPPIAAGDYSVMMEKTESGSLLEQQIKKSHRKTRLNRHSKESVPAKHADHKGEG